MTCVRDIMEKGQLEREFDSIRHVFKTLGKEERPLRIEWGTKEAMEAMERANNASSLKQSADLIKVSFMAGILLANASELRSRGFDEAAKWIEETVKPLFKEIDMELAPPRK